MDTKSFAIPALLIAAVAAPIAAHAQTAVNLNALKGLAPFSALERTPAGKTALAANLAVTKAVHEGTSDEPGLLPFAAAREQALKDAYITSANGAQLSDGLGTTLAAAYRARADYASSDDGATTTITQASPALENLIAYTFAVTSGDSGSAKFYFANETVSKKDGPAPVSADAAAIVTAANGETDVYGKAYGLPAGTPNADPYGNSRPFQTETGYTSFSAPDYFGVATSVASYLTGPAQPLVASPAFPSGHTTYGYTEALLFAILVPKRYPQMIARGAEYGNSRILVGAHYATDVIGGRTLAYYDVAHLLAEDPAYVGQTLGKVTIAKYADALSAAGADLNAALSAGCRKSVAACAVEDTGRFSDAAKDEAFCEWTQTYELPVVYDATAATAEDVGKLAPEAGYLLTAAFPNLTLQQADDILTKTESRGGGFLDNGSAFGVYSRLDLYRAASAAEALS